MSTLEMASRPSVGLRPCGGVELIGKYEGSGRQTDRYLVKRPDGAYVELTMLLYLVVSSLDGQRSTSEIAVIIGQEIDKTVSSENIDYLVEKLLPLGLIEAGDQPTLDRPDMALGLRVKKPVVARGLVSALTRVFQHLFHWPLVILTIAAFATVLADIFKHGYLRAGLTAIVNRPQLTLVWFGLMIFAFVWHELGHASACRFGGAKPGAIGGGLYLMWPALYTDVSDAYRLKRSGRVRTDLGGVYFNAIQCSVFVGIFQITHYTPLVLAAATTVLLMLEQLLPFVRFDGYWIVSDLAGVPDLFPRLGGAFRRRRPRHVKSSRHAKQGETLADLQPYSRRIIRSWAYATVVVLPIEFLVILLLSATLFVTFALALVQHYDETSVAILTGQPYAAAVGIIQILLLVLLMVGMAYGLCFLGFKLCRYAVRQWGRGLFSRIVIGTLVLAVLAAPVVWSALQVRLVHTS